MLNILKAAVAIIVVGVIARFAFIQMFGIDEIEYRGEQYRLSEKFVSYESYAARIAKLASDEIPRVEARLMQSKLLPHYATRAEFHAAVSDLKFPGFGQGGLRTSSGQPPSLLAQVIEIPQSGRDRYIVGKLQSDGSVDLVDDFVLGRSPFTYPSIPFSFKGLILGLIYGAPEVPKTIQGISAAKLENGKLDYYDRANAIVRSILIEPKN